MRPGSRTRLCHRLRRHTGRKGERRSLSERDYIALIDGMHHLVKAPLVLVWDRLNTHVSHAMRDLIKARDWLTVFTLPAYAPELNAVEYLWAQDRPRDRAHRRGVHLADLRVVPAPCEAARPGPHLQEPRMLI
jgi:hypothetical protein